MPIGVDLGAVQEPGRPVVRRIVGPKDEALERATAAGLSVLVGRYSVEKYEGEVCPENLTEIVECPPNLFLTTGVTRLWELVCGVNSTHLDATNSYLAVGDGTTAPDVAQSDLVGTNKARKKVSGGPVISGRQVTFSATFGTGDANFAWLEIGVGWSSSGNTLVSRAVPGGAGLGTKVNTAQWVLNWTLGIAAS